MADLSVDSADYELRWPKDLFARELRALGELPRTDGPPALIERLVEEAFDSDRPVLEYRSFGSPWDRDRYLVYVEELLALLPRLRERHRRPPLFSTRQGRSRPAPAWTTRQLRTAVAAVLRELHRDGYFTRELGQADWDKPGGADGPNKVLSERLGVEVWPLDLENCEEDLLFDLIETFHDLAARPRARRYTDTGYRYSGGYSTDVGRAYYRWRINPLLDRLDPKLRLADSGEDLGRLVQATDDARGGLVDRVLAAPDHQVADQVQHAIALFRRRGATTHDKRSAVVALANVLEDRRALLKSNLFSDDETQLFHIANRFDLRHRNDKQHTDYDPAFRDWVFWWYLATIELTDRIIERQSIQDSEVVAP